MAAAVGSLGAFAPSAPVGCAHARSCDGAGAGAATDALCPREAAAACPREAAVDSTGRCACADGDVLVVGACVPPAVAEAFCGPAAHAGGSGAGCAFRSCSATELLDAVTGACVPRASLPRGGAIACEGATMPIVEDGRSACVPLDATCPRGTRFRADASADASADAGAGAGVCVGGPACPAGTLNEGSSCRPVVTSGGRSGTRVDVGAWAALALGIDGGRGSPWLCQPLAQRPGVFAGDVRDLRAASAKARATASDARETRDAPGDATCGEALPIRISVSATFPDEDISRLHIEVDARGPGARALAPPAVAVISSDVSTLFELLRGLGGEASAAAVGLEVTCTLAPSR
jgi:hypothetical protein